MKIYPANVILNRVVYYIFWELAFHVVRENLFLPLNINFSINMNYREEQQSKDNFLAFKTR